MTTKTIYERISAAQADINSVGVGKQGINRTQRYRFRQIDDVYNALSPILAKHGIVTLPKYYGATYTTRPSREGGTLTYVQLAGKIRFCCGPLPEDRVTAHVLGEAMDSSDKASAKAMSMAIKNALLQVFLIPTEGDNDADASSPEAVSRPEPQKSKDDYTQEELLHIHDTIEAINKAENIDALRALWKQASAGSYLQMVEGAIKAKQKTQGW